MWCGDPVSLGAWRLQPFVSLSCLSGALWLGRAWLPLRGQQWVEETGGRWGRVAGRPASGKNSYWVACLFLMWQLERH